ncbi:MAG: thiamine pyrophosphate-binding protein [Patescibacteria group bacterium]|jgi:acetolactate synthase-1/2/3 large subunit
MKLSDYVAKFLEGIGDSVFLLSGGGIMHLVDSVSKSNLRVVCCHHEQAAVIAAEGYSRIKNYPGVAIVTTGPGGTNAVTGMAGAWLDSISIMVIGGQVKRDNITPRENGILQVRQIGFQELNVIDIVRPVTKYAVTVENENEIRYHLEKALYLATHGRPGPVFVEIPLDVQAAEIEPDNLKLFDPAELEEKQLTLDSELILKIVKLLQEAKRPLLMAGNGIRLAGGEEILWQVLEKIKINVVTPIFTADDLVTYDYPYYLGRQGMPGNESANYAVDNCDLLLVIGERLQLTQTSFDYDKFAIGAKKIMVDIDAHEMIKKTVNIDVPVNCDAKVFLEELYKQDIRLNRWDVQVKLVSSDEYPVEKHFLNVYKFINELGKFSGQMTVATANGMASVAPHQALKIVHGQRFMTNAGLGHMGSGLPMALGACIADGKKSVICMEGDGSIMLNIQELQTVACHKMPIKIFIFNNNGYYSIRGTHLRFFDKISASDPSSGVTLPDFSRLIPAWGLAYERINNDNELDKLKKVMEHDGPIVCELMLDPNQPMLGRWVAGNFKG